MKTITVAEEDLDVALLLTSIKSDLQSLYMRDLTSNAIKHPLADLYDQSPIGTIYDAAQKRSVERSHTRTAWATEQP